MPRKAGPHVTDRVMLAISITRQFDGIWIGSCRRSQDDLTRIERALLLVNQHSPVHYSRIIRELERIWINLVPHGVAAYYHSLKACVLDERFVEDTATSVEHIASAIVHESTHARLERYGIAYDEDQRARIEGICFRRELALAVRLPDGAKLQQGIVASLDWYKANPDYFREPQFRERYVNGQIEALRHLGAPKWLIRLLLISLSIIARTKRLFSIDRRSISLG